MSANEAVIGLEFLYSFLSNDSTLAGLAPGGVWRSLADPGTATPVVIIAFMSGADTTTMNGVRLISLPLYQVKAVGPANDTAAIASAAAQLDVAFGGKDGLKNIATSDGFIAALYREQPLVYDEPNPINGQMWTNIGGLYRLEIEAN